MTGASAARTTHGQIFLEEARRTLQAADRAAEAARSSLRGEIGTLAIGFFIGGTDFLFPALIRDFREHSPGVRVTLVEMTPTEQHEALLSGAIDIAFARAPRLLYAAELQTEHFYTEPLLAVFPVGHPLAGQPIEMRQLAAERFVIAQRETSPALFDKVIALCRRAGFSPAIAATSTVASCVLTLVAACDVIAILPKNTQKLAPADVAFSPIRSSEASIDLVIAWSIRREGPLHRSFLTLARKAKAKAKSAQG